MYGLCLSIYKCVLCGHAGDLSSMSAQIQSTGSVSCPMQTLLSGSGLGQTSNSYYSSFASVIIKLGVSVICCNNL